MASSPGTEGGAFEQRLIARLSRAMHAVWVKKQVAAGWHSAPIRDEAGRCDPSLVTFDRLPADQQRHWFNEAAEVIAVLDEARLQIRPEENVAQAAALDGKLLNHPAGTPDTWLIRHSERIIIYLFGN